MKKKTIHQLSSSRQLLHTKKIAASLTAGLSMAAISALQAQVAAPGSGGVLSDAGGGAAEAQADAASRSTDDVEFGTDSDWEVIGSLGLSLSSGNIDNALFSGDLTAARKWGENELILVGDFIYAETDSLLTNEYFHAGAKYNRELAGPSYMGALVDAVHDDIAKLDYRLTVSPFYGYKLIDNGATTLSIEGGPTYTFEDQFGVERDFAGIRIAELFEHQLSAKSKIWQSFEWLPEIEEFSNYLLKFELGASTQLTDKWGLKSFLRGTYDSDLASDTLEDTDWALITALSYAITADETMTDEDLAAAQAELGTSGDWQSTALFGLTATGGNSETLLFNATALTAREWGPHTLGLSAGGTYGEIEGAINAQTYYASAAHKYAMADPLYFATAANYLHDDLAAVDYRISVIPNLGINLIDNDRKKLFLEGGPTYIFEDVGGIEDDYLAYRLAGGLEKTLSVTSKIWAGAEYLGDFDESDNYLINSEVGIDTSLSDKLSLKTFVQYVYDNTPAAGFEDTDIRLISALAVTF